MSSLRQIEEEGAGEVVEEFGLEEEELRFEEGAQGKNRNKDVLSPNTRKTTDRRREMGRECEPSAEVGTLKLLY